jgi:hypothetical protein
MRRRENRAMGVGVVEPMLHMGTALRMKYGAREAALAKELTSVRHVLLTPGGRVPHPREILTDHTPIWRKVGLPEVQQVAEIARRAHARHGASISPCAKLSRQSVAKESHEERAP